MRDSSFLFLGWIYLRNVATRTSTTAQDARTAQNFQYTHTRARARIHARRKDVREIDDENVGDRERKMYS